MPAPAGIGHTSKVRRALDSLQARRGVYDRSADYLAGRITFAELDASVQGWINHVRYADTWGLRRHVFATLLPIPQPKDSASDRAENPRGAARPFP